MVTSGSKTLLLHLRRAALLGAGPEISDGQLLEQFISRRDEAAFATLVRRHGPLVFGVCRRIIGNVHDAEDAFQATFLVLARKAANIARREAVGNWLYGVAYRTARRAKAAATRRWAREKQVNNMPHPMVEPVDCIQDLAPVLDEEVNKLADKYRLPLVLCLLEGRPRRQVARHLNLPEGTLSTRLARARKILDQGLRRRGVTLSAGALATILGSDAALASVPLPLASSTVKAAISVAAGSAAASWTVSAKVVVLTEGVLNALLLTKLGIALGVLLAASILACGVATLAPPSLVIAQTPDRGQAPAARKQPKPGHHSSGPGTLLLWREEGPITMTPEGKEGAVLAPVKDTKPGFEGRLSPDGSRAAYVVDADPDADPSVRKPPWPFKLVVSKLGAAEPTAVVDLSAHGLVLTWAPNGKRLAVTKETAPMTFESVLLDPETGKIEPLNLPAGVRIMDWSRDGKTFLVVHRHDNKYQLGLTVSGGKDVRMLTDLKRRFGYDTVGRFSPDGAKVLYADADPADERANKWGVSCKPHLLDVASKKVEPLPDFPANAQALGVAWAPDGMRIAYIWRQLYPDLLKKDRVNANETAIPTESFLVVADANGRNAKTVYSAKGNFAFNTVLGGIDWR